VPDAEELAPGVTAVEVGAICPDEAALHIAIGDGTIAFGDALTRPGGGPLGFVPRFCSRTANRSSVEGSKP
jgi:hypothetical protein